MCDGPPGREIMMADFIGLDAEPAGAAVARRRSWSARVRPAPKAPSLRKLRRCRPSQNVWRLPRNVSMGKGPRCEDWGGRANRRVPPDVNADVGGRQWKLAGFAGTRGRWCDLS